MAVLARLGILEAAPVVYVALVGQPSPTPTPGNPGGQGEEFGKSSPVGLVVILLFAVAVVFLIRSMNKHLRRVPESFDKPGGNNRDDQTDNPPRE
jgi:hypothetical protein